MRTTLILSALSALAATIAALPTTAATASEAPTLDERQICPPGGYFKCVSDLVVQCNFQLSGKTTAAWPVTAPAEVVFAVRPSCANAGTQRTQSCVNHYLLSPSSITPYYISQTLAQDLQLALPTVPAFIQATSASANQIFTAAVVLGGTRSLHFHSSTALPGRIFLSSPTALILFVSANMSLQESSPYPSPPKSVRAGESQELSSVTRPTIAVERQHTGQLKPILEFIHRHFDTYGSDQPYDPEDFVACISIPAEQELQQEIRKNPALSEFVDRRVYYRWLSPEPEHGKGLLVLRMVSLLHSVVTGRLCMRIIKRAEKIVSTSPDVTAAVKDNTDFELLPESEILTKYATSKDGKSASKVPDCAIEHTASGSTTLIVEVAYSEKEEDLYNKALTLLELGKGELRTAIAIKLKYQSPEARAQKSAGEAYYVVHRWENGVCAGRKIKNVCIRDAEGNVSAGALELRLSDLCPSESFPPNDDPRYDPPISISHDMLNL
ncbi:hypothetical protein SVAN01_09420 [Stagonosporopsis vannaccii]|nr:hypothetical protein SVAN01_09420 [Stagonosporopsis vannaccii]